MTSHTTASRARASRTAPRRALQAFLEALAGHATARSLFEIRERHGQLMSRRFIATGRPEQAAGAILRAARTRDVYVGAALRCRREGGRDAIPTLATLWIDADTTEAIERLHAFRPIPSIVIASGRGRHAYWLLDHPVDRDTAEDANRRLAQHLHADIRCADAARILRPPHTTNYGYRPPQPVRLLRFEPCRRALDSITAALPTADAAQRRIERLGLRDTAGDPLLALQPAFYVGALLGVRVPRDGKLSCPFHTDEHPSLHVYPSAREGWYCFSCRRGGSVYDLAALLWGMEPRGRAFLDLRERLRRRLLGPAA